MPFGGWTFWDDMTFVVWDLCSLPLFLCRPFCEPFTVCFPSLTHRPFSSPCCSSFLHGWQPCLFYTAASSHHSPTLLCLQTLLPTTTTYPCPNASPFCLTPNCPLPPPGSFCLLTAFFFTHETCIAARALSLLHTSMLRGTPSCPHLPAPHSTICPTHVCAFNTHPTLPFNPFTYPHLPPVAAAPTPPLFATNLCMHTYHHTLFAPGQLTTMPI